MANDDWVDWLGKIATVWGSDFVLVSIKATVVLAVTALILRSTRRASSSFRHLILFAAITSPVALTLLPRMLPRWHTQIPASMITGWISSRVATGPIDELSTTKTTARGFWPGNLPEEAPTETQASPSGALGVSDQLFPHLVTVPVWSVPTHVWLFVLWLVGAGLLAAHLIVAHLCLWTKCRLTTPIHDSEWNEMIGECARRFGVSRRVTLTFSQTQSMPMVCGILKPRIVLPAEAATWPSERRRAVLQHELAHIARRDCLTSLIARSICILHWFNPFLWGLLRMMKNERERACDDLVLDTGVRASTYAAQVLSVAARFGKTHSSIAGLAMARPSQLEGRLLAVLDSTRNRKRMTRRSGFCTVGLTMLMLVPIAAITTATAMKDSEEAGDGRSDEETDVDGDSNAPRGLEHWNSDTLLDALRSPDRKLRRTAEADILTMGSDHPVVDAIVDRLLIDLGSDNTSLRQQSAWELEKTRSPRIVEPLVELLRDDAPGVRAAAAGALGETGDPRAIAPLRNLSGDENADVREWSARALGSFGEPEAADSLLEYLQDDSPNVREWAARGLSNFRAPEVFEALADALTDDSASVREWAARSLGDSSAPFAAEALMGALADDSGDVREWAARSLGSIGSPAAVAALSNSLSDDKANVREWSARALGNIGDVAAAESLAGALSDDDPDVRASAARSLGYVGGANDVDYLAEALADENADVRQMAAQALGHIADPAAVPALEEILTDADRDVRESAMRALGRIASPEAMRLLDVHLQADGSNLQETAREAIESVERRRDPARYFLRKYSHEDSWIRLARTYVVKHGIEEREALKHARKAVKKRDAFVKENRKTKSDRLELWIERLRKDYLVAGLERMAEQSSSRRGARQRGK